jgi:corrinoid protein of di/trimethylamine methyltransferase
MLALGGEFLSKEQEIMDNLKKAVETYNVDLAKKSAQAALDAGIDPGKVVESGLGKGMETISKLFDEATIFLPQVLAASAAMEAGLKVLEPAMAKGKSAAKGIFVIGTVQGDIHEIGKNVIAAMARGGGFTVVDLGRDVAPEKFVDAVKEHKANIVGASALMTTTVIIQRDIVEQLKADKVKVKTIFGGAPASAEWVKEIGGDVYCPSGAEVNALLNKIIKG